MNILKLLLLLGLVSLQMYACPICAIISPYTNVSLEVNTSDNKITEIETKLVLTKEFTNELKLIYDKNINGNLDFDEVKEIKEAFQSYAETKNYMTHISYSEIVNKKTSNEFLVKDLKAYIQNEILHLKYKLVLNYELKNNYALYIKMQDEENYFLLNFDKNSLHFNNVNTKKIIKENEVIFLINTNQDFTSLAKNAKHEKKEKAIIKKDEVDIKEESFLSIYTHKIKYYLLKVKDGDIKALIILCFISFLYGIIHALGPGHGKTLSFSYFSSKKSTYIKAAMISLSSSFIHILGAMLLVLISVFILESSLNNFVSNSVEVLSKIAAIFIIVLASFILYKKLRRKHSASCSCCNSNNNKQDLYFIITSGLVPCPGTVILFIYAFMLKTYYAVLLASIFISLGMAVIMFVSSFFAISLKNISKNSKNITNIIEIISPIVMFILGVFLYFNASLL